VEDLVELRVSLSELLVFFFGKAPSQFLFQHLSKSMGNSLKRGYKAISLRDLRPSKFLSHHHTPANCQDEKPKAFMRIEEEDQLDEILDAIEQVCIPWY
jgi:hypothetical protein